MQVLKRGQIPGERVHRATCSHCKSELEFKQSEGKVTYDQRDGDYVSVTCPVCNSLVTSSLHSGPSWR